MNRKPCKRWRQTKSRQSSPIDDKNSIQKFSVNGLDASKTNAKLSPGQHRQIADTEILYRPRIVDMDINWGHRFCGPRSEGTGTAESHRCPQKSARNCRISDFGKNSHQQVQRNFARNFPKHLSKGRLGEVSLRGKIFRLKDNFPLKMAFPFPQNGLCSQEMKGLGKKGVFMPARENLPQGIFCLKGCLGYLSSILLL